MQIPFKRTQQSFRIKTHKLITLKSLIAAAQIAESELLTQAIISKQAEIEHLNYCVSLTDKSKLLTPIDNEIRSVQKALDRKRNWLRKLYYTHWKDWPVKNSKSMHSSSAVSQPTIHKLALKKHTRTVKNKDRRAGNRILKLSKSALDMGSVLIYVVYHLSRIVVYNVYQVLLPFLREGNSSRGYCCSCKRIGFVPTSNYNQFQNKVDANIIVDRRCVLLLDIFEQIV